jgi:hypothetical protein
MPEICDMGRTALVPFRRKACWGGIARYWLLKSSQICLHVSQFEPGVQDYSLSLGVLHTQTHPHFGYNLKNIISGHIPYFQSSDVQVLYVIFPPSFSPFSIVFSNQRFGSLSTIMDVGFVELFGRQLLWKQCLQYWYWVCCHPCSSSSLIFIQSPLQCMAVTLSIGFWPPVL